MARSQRSQLERRTNRLKLPKGHRETVVLGQGLSIRYRRARSNYGTWQARVWHNGKFHYRTIGAADDYQEANGTDVLDFFQAQRKAAEFFDLQTKGRIGGNTSLTVKEAAERYLTWFREHRRSIRDTEKSVQVHILPSFGLCKVSDLTTPMIRSWHEKLAANPARLRSKRFAKEQNYRPAAKTLDEKRARRATANRILTVLRAILNRAFHDGLVADDTPWRRVKPFPKVDESRIRFLTDPEAIRLVNACQPDLRALVQGALVTGARFSELATLRVADVNLRTKHVYISNSKSGKPRHIPLNESGISLFSDSLVGKVGDALVFTRSDGRQWGHNHHAEFLKRACKKSKISPPISFHHLRHSFGSALAQAGVDLLTISKLLGHADTRITSLHYAHLSEKSLAVAVTKLPSFSADHRELMQQVKEVRG